MLQYFDSLVDLSGNALLGATLTVTNYPSGSAASIYSTNGTASPIAGAVVSADITGQVSFFIADGAYIFTYAYKSTVYKVRSPVQLGDPMGFVTATDSGTANAYAVVSSAYPASVYTGLKIAFKAANTNTGASTLQLNGGTVYSIVAPGGTALAAGVIVAGGIYRLEFDGTNFELFDAPTQSAVAPLVNPETTAEIAASATPTNYLYQPWRGEDPRRFGATGLGLVDDHAAFVTANSVGQSIYVPPGTYRISTNTTITVPISFDNGAVIKPDAGVTFTINAPVNAPPTQIFNTSNSGAICTGNLQNPFVYAEWWGALGNNSNDDSGAINQALATCAASGYITLQLLAKTYKVNSVIWANGNYLSTGTASYFTNSIRGVPGLNTVINGASISAGSNWVIAYVGSSGGNTHAYFDDILLEGNTSIAGISLQGTNFFKARGCRFATLNVGMQFYNLTASSFTEYCVAEHCEFTSTCNYAVQYVVSSGSISFHGSGLTERCIVNCPNGAFLINSGSSVYNAPADLQLFSAANVSVFVNNSTYSASFHGTITVENQGGTITLAGGSGANVYFSGPLASNGSSTVSGNLIHCEGVVLNSDGSKTPLNPRVASQTALSNTGVALPCKFAEGHVLIWVRIYATNYDERFLLSMNPVAGTTGGVVTLASYVVNNGAAYGTPTFTCNSSGQLVITNTNYPASGVTAYWSQLGLNMGLEGSVAYSQI